MKPNREELAESAELPIDTVADVILAAERMRAQGARTVLASLGVDGAVLVDDQGVRWGESPVDGGRSAVGAGDAMLAGFLAASSAGGDALAEALAWGAAAVRLPGSRMPGTSDVDRASVRVPPTPDRTRRLHAPQHGMERIQ